MSADLIVARAVVSSKALLGCGLALWLGACGADGQDTIAGIAEGSEALRIQEVVFSATGDPLALLTRPTGGVLFVPLDRCGSELIYGRLHDTLPPRPVTYDLFRTIADDLNATVHRVALDLHAVSDSVVATVTINGPLGATELPATATDAIGIAQATGAEIYGTSRFLALPDLASSSKTTAYSNSTPQTMPARHKSHIDGTTWWLANQVPRDTQKVAGDDFVGMSILGLFGSPFGVAHVLLIDGDDSLVLTIFIHPCNAFSLFTELSNLESPEPLIHPLLNRVMSVSGGRLADVRIVSVEDHTFIGEIGLSHDGVRSYIDARPSDAFVLATIANAPIQVARTVLDEFSDNAADFEELIAEIRSLETD